MDLGLEMDEMCVFVDDVEKSIVDKSVEGYFLCMPHWKCLPCWRGVVKISMWVPFFSEHFFRSVRSELIKMESDFRTINLRLVVLSKGYIHTCVRRNIYSFNRLYLGQRRSVYNLIVLKFIIHCFKHSCGKIENSSLPSYYKCLKGSGCHSTEKGFFVKSPITAWKIQQFYK